MKKTTISNISNSVIATGNVSGKIKNNTEAASVVEPESNIGIKKLLLTEDDKKNSIGKLVTITLLSLVIILIILLKFA